MDSDLTLTAVSFAAGRTLLDDVSLTFHAGEVTALSGPSGSGKTTLLSVAGGLLEPTDGSATFRGEPMWRGTGDPRPEIAFVLQVYGLVPILSALENVSIALRARGVAPFDADDRAEAALARFHIADLGDRQVEELSGGQMQRVACARAFVVGADILFADEPTSELDEGNRGLVLRELRAEAERGAIVVVATHDPAVVEACDRHYALDEGVLIDPTRPVPERPAAAAEVADAELAGEEPEGAPQPALEVAQESAPEPGFEPAAADRAVAEEPSLHLADTLDAAGSEEARRSPFARPEA